MHFNVTWSQSLSLTHLKWLKMCIYISEQGSEEGGVAERDRGDFSMPCEDHLCINMH